MSEKNRFTFIAIVAFALLFIIQYSATQNRIQTQSQIIEALQVEISQLNIRLSAYAHQISALESNYSESEEKPATLNISELPGFRIIFSDSFETFGNGTLPIMFRQIKGTDQDNIFVSENDGYESGKCLQLVENGDDGDNCKVRLDFEDVNSSIVFSVYIKVMGYDASRAVLHFVNEDNVTFSSMNCLLDYRWGNRGPGYWEPMDSLPVPVWGEWYHLQVVLDQESQKVRYIVDGFDSGWLNTTRQWSSITAVDLRGNYNYPAVSRYDDIILAVYDN